MIGASAQSLDERPHDQSICRRRKMSRMACRMAGWIVAASIGATTAHAHHSIAGVYDAARRLRLEGVVTAVRFVNPHPFIELEAIDAAGRTQQWRLEMDNRFELIAAGMTADTLRPGNRVIVTGSGARDSSSSLYVRRLERPSDGLLYEQVGNSPRVRLPR